MVVAQLVCCSKRFLFGPGNLNYGPFGTLFGLNKFFNVIEGEAGLEVIVGGVFLYDVFRYGGILRSMHQGVHYHLIYVGGLAHK